MNTVSRFKRVCLRRLYTLTCCFLFLCWLSLNILLASTTTTIAFCIVCAKENKKKETYSSGKCRKYCLEHLLKQNDFYKALELMIPGKDAIENMWKDYRRTFYEKLLRSQSIWTTWMGSCTRMPQDSRRLRTSMRWKTLSVGTNGKMVKRPGRRPIQRKLVNNAGSEVSMESEIWESNNNCSAQAVNLNVMIVDTSEHSEKSSNHS